MRRVRNLAELAEESAERQGERVMFVFAGEPVTNAVILERARRLQGGFGELGLRRGDIMCLCIMNNPYVYSIFGAGFRCGATVVPVMFQLTVPELRYIFGHTEAKCIITDNRVVEKVREAVKGLEHVEWIAVLGGQDDEARSPREYALEKFLQREEQPVIGDMDPDDVALMLYTSGTTGRPKGVMLTHANLLAQGEAGLDAAEYAHREHPIISINALPMAHIFGVGAMNASYMLPGEYARGAYTVQEAWFDAERFMQLIDEHRCNDMSCVPTMLALLLGHPKVSEYNLRTLRTVNVGAAPVPVDLARAFSERTGCRIRQLYGMTENAGIATCDRISKPYRPGSAGLPYKGVELRIVDDRGNSLPAGTPGEIVTRGPTTMKGYFKQPDVTAETMRGGWLHTGDIGKLDEDGWLYVVDRKKDMIIKGGENIFPAEIENALYELDEVTEAAVVGVPHDLYGEDVIAFVVLKPGRALSEEAVIAHVKTLVSSFKAPSQVHFVPQLPKSGVGKILRRELREQAKALVSRKIV